MALDKQRILSELGSVMNQLQSADCGCMGKLFNSGQSNAPMGNPLPTCSGCRNGCCRGHGYGVHYNNGEPPMSGGGMCRNGMPTCQGGMNMGVGGGMCCGAGGGMAGNAGMNPDYKGMSPNGMAMCGCGMGIPPNNSNKLNSLKDSAPRLYSDTYNFLNQNLMRPIVNEVYEDLKSLTPENAVGNSHLAKQIPALASSGQSQNQNMVTGAMGNSMPMNTNPASGDPMKTMGQQILNMMMSRNKPNAETRASAGGMQGGLVSSNGEGMLIDAPHSPHGQIGLTPVTPSTGPNPNANTNMAMGNIHMVNPPTQYVTADNMYSLPPEANLNNAQGNMSHNMNPEIQKSTPATGLSAGSMNPRPGVSPGGANNYGPHNMGMRTFQKMFPGVAEGGDLGFDPMAIAIQMNPANQKRVAMDNMNKIMNNKPMIRSNMMQPAVQGSNAPSSQLAQQPQQNAPAGQQMLTTNQQYIQNVMPGQQGLTPVGTVGEQQVAQGQQQGVSPGGFAPQNQQIYTAFTETPLNQPMQQQQNQGQVQQQQLQGQVQQQHLQGQVQPQTLQGQQEYQQGQAYYQQQGQTLQPQGQVPQQQMIDPSTGAPLNYTDVEDPNAQIQNQGMIKEPLYPAEASRNTVAYAQPTFNNYNTLGQPVSLENPANYHTPIPPLPQTLSPQDPRSYKVDNSVKNTMSKTSLAANRVIGPAPSKSQLRHIYRQYKAGHAGMQQSIRPPQGGSQSDGKLYPPGGANAQINYVQGQAPIESVGGDNIQNVRPMSGDPGQNIGQRGDVNQKKPQSDITEKTPMMQSNGKNRNGLQDMRFTKYIETNGWSFHGDYSGVPSYAYRSRRA